MTGPRLPVPAPRLAVLASGEGTNLQAIIDAIGGGRLEAGIAVLVTNRPGCRAVARARLAGIDVVEVVASRDEPRQCFDARLTEVLEPYQVDWVILAGWMRLLSMQFLGAFPGRVVNLHPALPGCFPGVDAIERAHAAHLDGGSDRTGVMVHLVPDEGIDDGPVLAVRELTIGIDEPLSSLERRMHALEHEVLVDVLTSLCSTRSRRRTPDMEER